MVLELLVKATLARVLGPSVVDRIRRFLFIQRMRRGGKAYWEKEIELLPRLVTSGDVCMDIGANYGVYTYHLSNLVGRSGHVYSFEPLPVPFKILLHLRDRFALGNVTPYQVALCESPGRRNMSVPKSSSVVPEYGAAYLKSTPTESGPILRSGGAEEEVEVEARTVDEIATSFLGPVKFIKCDVEGAELFVLQGALSTIRTTKPTILCEIEERHTRRYGHSADSVLRWLVSEGYGAFRYLNGQLAQVNRIVPEENNYIFISG